jgi:hypothetical protein
MPRGFKIKPVAALQSLRDMTAREKQFLLSEMGEIKGLVPLVMKQRNRQRWSTEDRALLVTHLRRLSRISPYLAVLAMPGGFIMMPALAWWLDRRRNRNRLGNDASAPN